MNPATILIVDDEQTILLALKRVFEKNKHRIIAADTGTKAIQAINESGPIHAAIVDLMLPDMSGLDLIAWIKSRSPKVLVFAMSALMDEATKKKLTSSGAHEVLSKPFEDIFEIPKIVRHALQREAARRESRQN